MEIAVVLAHVMHFRLLFLLSHQQVDELGAILVVVKANQEVPDVCQEDQEEHQDHQRKSILVVMEGWSDLLLRFRVSSVGADIPSPPSRTQPLSTHAGQMRC